MKHSENMSLDLNIVFITKSESPFITLHLFFFFYTSMNQENEMIHQWQDLAAMQIVVQRNTC